MLYWALLKFVTAKGCKEFDFGRSTFNEGTFRFKQQWGAKPTLLEWRKDNVQSASQTGIVNSTSSIKSLVENIWKKLPLTVANTIGPKLRRYISL